MAEQNAVNAGHTLVEMTFLDRISIDHLFENMVQASVYSLNTGEDQLPSIEQEVLEFLFDEDIII